MSEGHYVVLRELVDPGWEPTPYAYHDGHEDLLQESCPRCGAVRLWQASDIRGRPVHAADCVNWTHPHD